MKIVKAASGKSVLKMSKTEWLAIGKKAGFGGIDRWEGSTGSIVLSIAPAPQPSADGKEIWIDEDGKAMPEPFNLILNQMQIGKGVTQLDDYHEVTIEFTSSGYDDPGRFGTSDPSDSYPPEGEDNREVKAVLLDGKPMSPEMNQWFQEMYQDRIDGEEVTHYDDREYEPDDGYEERNDFNSPV